MRNKKNAGKKGSDFSPLDDDHVLELAEEVLGSSDDEIIILDDESDTEQDASEDIIDLTDINDMPLGDDEDILDLTDELEEASEEDAEIMELQDIAGQAADEDDEVMELEDAIEAFNDSDGDEGIMTLEEVVESSDDTEADIIDLGDTEPDFESVGVEAAPDTREFSIETDTIELSEADRKALEEEFGLEPSDALQHDISDLAASETAERSETIETETEETHLEDTLEMADLPKAAAEKEDEPIGADDEDILELSDDDRASLEEALNNDFKFDSETLTDEAPELEMPADESGSEFAGAQADDTIASALDVEEATEDDILDLSEVSTDISGETPSYGGAATEADIHTPADTADSDQGEDEIDFTLEEPGPDDTLDLVEEVAEEAHADAAAAMDESPQTGEEELRLDFEDDFAPQAAAASEPKPDTIQVEDEIQLESQDEAEPVDTASELATAAALEASEEADELQMPGLSEEDEQILETDFELDAGPAAAAEDIVETESPFEASTEPAPDVETSGLQPHDPQALAEDLGLSLEEEQPTLSAEPLGEETEGEREAEALSAQSLFDEGAQEEDLAEKEDDFIESLGMTIESEMAPPLAAGMTAETQVPLEEPPLSMDFDQPDDAGGEDLHKTADPISIRVKEHADDNHTSEDELLNKVFQPEAETAAEPTNLEQTVERLVNKMFAEKIEVILVNAIERAVSKEIERLKSVLLGEINRMD